MQISVFGRTDKRACIYTLMKILQPLGDVAVITSNRHFMRLTEDGAPFGFYQNISIFVTDATADEMWQTIDHKPGDFDHIIMDNLYNESTDLIIYVQGAGVEASDEYLFDTFEDPHSHLCLLVHYQHELSYGYQKKRPQRLCRCVFVLASIPAHPA